MKRANTTIVMFDKSKLTAKELEHIYEKRDGIFIDDANNNIIIYDVLYKNHQFMLEMVDLLYKSVKR